MIIGHLIAIGLGTAVALGIVSIGGWIVGRFFR